MLLAIDNGTCAVETYRLNFPATPVFANDIATLSVEECCQLAGIRPGRLDVLDGSPSCQGFSMIGGRDFADRRNRLYLEFVRLLRGIRPRTFVLENVSGLVKGTMRVIFVDCLKELKASGYRIRNHANAAFWWRVLAWGTRSDTRGGGDDYYMSIYDSEEATRIIFDTAWSPPVRVIREMSRQYPTLAFRLVYYEDGEGFAAEAAFKSGNGDDRLYWSGSDYDRILREYHGTRRDLGLEDEQDEEDEEEEDE